MINTQVIPIYDLERSQLLAFQKVKKKKNYCSGIDEYDYRILFRLLRNLSISYANPGDTAKANYYNSPAEKQ